MAGGLFRTSAPAAPGGTTAFLRADGTYAVPPAGEGGGPAFPIGSVFIAVVSTNPGTLLGYGTWSAIAAGRVLVGIDAGDADFDTVEETGGAKTVTLSEAQIPAHTHVQDAHNHTQNAHSHGMAEGTTDGSGTFMDRSNAAAATTATTDAATATNQATTATNQTTGGGGAHSNVQPYLVVYMWKRTA